jgi:hypothetical protein
VLARNANVSAGRKHRIGNHALRIRQHAILALL